MCALPIYVRSGTPKWAMRSQCRLPRGWAGPLQKNLRARQCMTKVGFEFPRDESQQWDGFNEPGIEHFSGSPFRSLGREGTQNTVDAAKGLPARIDIRRIDVPTDSIPGADGLRKALELCAQERSEEHTSELQSLMRISSAVLCLKKKKK